MILKVRNQHCTGTIAITPDHGTAPRHVASREILCNATLSTPLTCDQRHRCLRPVKHAPTHQKESQDLLPRPWPGRTPALPIKPRRAPCLKHPIYAATAVILAWLGLCAYALATGQAAELHDLGTITVHIIEALITRPIHDFAA